MENKEARELIRELAGALQNAISDLQTIQDVFDEEGYIEEIAVYERAVAWLREQNKG